MEVVNQGSDADCSISGVIIEHYISMAAEPAVGQNNRRSPVVNNPCHVETTVTSEPIVLRPVWIIIVVKGCDFGTIVIRNVELQTR